MSLSFWLLSSRSIGFFWVCSSAEAGSSGCVGSLQRLFFRSLVPDSFLLLNVSSFDISSSLGGPLSISFFTDPHPVHLALSCLFATMLRTPLVPRLKSERRRTNTQLTKSACENVRLNLGQSWPPCTLYDVGCNLYGCGSRNARWAHYRGERIRPANLMRSGPPGSLSICHPPSPLRIESEGVVASACRLAVGLTAWI